MSYIDVDRIDWRLIIPTNATTAEENMIYQARKLVASQPKADVVEVVRCRDCKWYGIYELKKDGSLDRRYKPSFCYLYREHHEESWYCADAERRTE